MKNEQYEKLKKFIISNYKIKKEMVNMRPPLDTDAISHDAIVKYTNNAYDSLRFIIRELKNMAILYDDTNNTLSKTITELSSVCIKQFIECKTDINKLRSFYHHYVTNMDKEIVEDVKVTCIGYTAHFFPMHTLRKS